MRENKIPGLVLNAELTASQLIVLLENELKEAYEDGYDQAAQDITLKIQSCIPSNSPTVADARVQGAWRDAANIALNHLGKLSNQNYPE